MSLRSLTSIKFLLALLVTVCIVPASVTSVILLSYDYYHDKEQLVVNAVTTARTVAYAVDKEFSSTEATLRALETSPSLTTAQLAVFFQQAQQLALGGHVQNIFLTKPSGKQLINTLRPYGELLPQERDTTRLRLLADTDGPVVSSLFTGAVSRQPTIAVSVPVRRAGKHLYNLGAGIYPGQLAQLLKQQQLPPDWIVAVIDSSGKIVARSHEMGRLLGKDASPSLTSAMAFDNEGWTESETSEGIAVLAAFSRSAVTNWTVAIGIPVASLTQELRAKLGWLVLAIITMFASSLTVASFIGTRIARAIRALRGPALALGLGNVVEIPPLRLREANEVAKALKKASVILNEARHQATHDLLTGLPNRGMFAELVNKQIAVCESSDTQFTVMYIDLDGFKPVNDVHGHSAGDMLLCEVASRLRSQLRGADMAARLGGDEFAVILVGTHGGTAKSVASKLVDILSAVYSLDGSSVRISASIGLAGYPEAGTQVHELLHAADVAMYGAKAMGKGRVVCSTSLLET